MMSLLPIEKRGACAAAVYQIRFSAADCARAIMSLGLILTCSLIAATASAQIVVTDLGTLGGNSSYANSVNAAGQIVGGARTAGDFVGPTGYLQHAFLWTEAGGMIDLGTLGGSFSYANVVNPSGQVVGQAETGDLGQHAFSWTEIGGMIDLGTLGGRYSTANHVNASGQVVGWASLPGDLASHAFLWTETGGMIDLGTLGGGTSNASAVNDSGQVVGWAATAGGGQHAFSWTQAGGMIDLGTLGGGYSFAHAVNTSGQVVGQAATVGGAVHVFSWTQTGGMIDLGTLGGSFGYAQAVNDSGQVVGASFPAGDFDTHAFSWTQAGGMIDLGTLGGSRSAALMVTPSLHYSPVRAFSVAGVQRASARARDRDARSAADGGGDVNRLTAGAGRVIDVSAATPPARGCAWRGPRASITRARRRARAPAAPRGRRRDGIAGNAGRTGGRSVRPARRS